MKRPPLRHLLFGLGGLVAGGVFLWLALARVDAAEVRKLVATIRYPCIAWAVAFYWVALSLRCARWYVLLRELAEVTFRHVAETLIVGYAVNNVLPARLGEVARAAYAKRRLRVGYARVFGSIVVERLLDLIAIFSCLMGGLLIWGRQEEGVELPAFELIAVNAGAFIGVVILVLAALRLGAGRRWRMPRTLQTILRDFLHGIGSLNGRSAMLGISLTAVVWIFEIVAMSHVFLAVGVELSPTQAALLMGAASLSTLVPTAPGYVGTYQFVAVIAMAAFGFSESAGIVAASAIQIAFFGSVSTVGAVILIARALSGGRSAARADTAVGRHAQSASENGVKSVSSSK